MDVLSRESSHHLACAVHAKVRPHQIKSIPNPNVMTNSTNVYETERLSVLPPSGPLLLTFSSSHPHPSTMTACNITTWRCAADRKHDQHHAQNQKEAEICHYFSPLSWLGLPCCKLISGFVTNCRLGLFGEDLIIIVTQSHCQNMPKQGLPQEIFAACAGWVSR